MAMENEDYGELLQHSAHEEPSHTEDQGSFEPASDAVPTRTAFSRRVTRTSKQPWYEPYLREIRRTH